MSDLRSRQWLMIDSHLEEKPKFLELQRLTGLESAQLCGVLYRLWAYSERVSRRSFDSVGLLARASKVPEEVIEAMTSKDVKWIRKRKGGRKGVQYELRMWKNSKGEVYEDEDEASVEIGPGSVADRPPDRLDARGGTQDKTRRDETGETRLEETRLDEPEERSFKYWREVSDENGRTNRVG